ncbi:unnamed protein product [Urochloa humidicola]
MRVVERADDGLRVTRMAVPLRDTEEENLLDHLEPCLHFTDEGRKVIASPGSPGVLFMALQPRTITCGNKLAAFAMAVRFLMGPAVMAAASIAVGLRGVRRHIAIVQYDLVNADC